ncbi:hypothetical protein [uncultured Methylobacterium sp.]|jgi:hypothetical protein|uniref:hypothetical protein n=1 Tax=uncultured Methylobacterium sp. TaxID=157278 RepID=UPI002618D19D|nr:hypothetical protein [uncultured Methylobacterium sp.]
MDDHTPEDAAVGMAEALRLTQESGETNGIEDRTAADLLRRKGFSPERIRKWFGYIPRPIAEDTHREEAHVDYEAAAFVSLRG